VILAFQVSHPTIQVNTQQVPYEDLHDTFVAAMATHQGPTLLIGSADWGAEFWDNHLIADVSTLASADLLDTIHDTAIPAVQYKGALIGLPHTTKGVVMFRNTSIIPDPVTTYQELVTAAQEAAHDDVVGANLERGFFFAAGHLHGLGGQLMNDRGCPAFNNQKGIDWVNLLDSFDDAGPTVYYTDEDIELFKAGKAGFIIDGTWNMGNIAGAINIADLAIDPWPTPLSGYVQVENIYLNADVTGAERADGWAFMEYLLSPQAQELMLDGGHIPVVSGVTIADPLMQQAVDTFAGGTIFPVLPQLGAYWVPMDTALLAVFNGTAEPAQALQQASDTIIADLATMGYSCLDLVYLPFVTR
jgi:arabinogalactan oligomer/maltooligosaccharide transport system substrate-binding protein